MNAPKQSHIQVDNNNVDSYRTFPYGDTNAIIIPFLFQYRMSDALGRPGGTSDAGIDLDNLKYTKTIGVDIKVFGKTFSFDLRVSAAYRSITTNTDNIPFVSNTELQDSILRRR